MTVPTSRKARLRLVRERGRWIGRGWRAWQRRGEVPARVLLLSAGAASFLSAAATIHAVYTVQPSYLLAAAGVALGLPWVIAAWMSAGPLLRGASLALIAVYVASLLAGHPMSVPGSPRTGRTRELVYVADLCVGLGTVGAIAGLWGGRDGARAMPAALLVGGLLGAAYAVYQWFGLRFHLPFVRINNTLNSNGITTGASQGVGVLGWERAQGTFLEPHFLGAYLASLSALCAGFALSAERRLLRLCLWVAALVMLAALLASGSAPAWGSLALFGIAGAGLSAILQGRPVRAALSTSAVVGALALLVLVGSRQAAALGTGRPTGSIALTTQFRTATWSRAIELWAHEPILGGGPGQASVRLTLAGVDQALFKAIPSRALLSSQGLWAAALLDSGLLGLGAWALFLGAVVSTSLRALFARRDYLAAGLLSATGIAVFGSLTAGDRLELWTWLLFGAVLAAASSQAGGTTGEGGKEPG